MAVELSQGEGGAERIVEGRSILTASFPKVIHELSFGSARGTGCCLRESRLFGATISTRPFRRHLFRCHTFSAQIVSTSIWCFLTDHLFRVWVRVRALG